MKYVLDRYRNAWNDYRTEVQITEGEAWITYIVMGGSGFATRKLTAGDTWREGPDELVGVFATEEEANAAMH